MDLHGGSGRELDEANGCDGGDGLYGNHGGDYHDYAARYIRCDGVDWLESEWHAGS